MYGITFQVVRLLSKQSWYIWHPQELTIHIIMLVYDDWLHRICYFTADIQQVVPRSATTKLFGELPEIGAGIQYISIEYSVDYQDTMHSLWSTKTLRQILQFPTLWSIPSNLHPLNDTRTRDISPCMQSDPESSHVIYLFYIAIALIRDNISIYIHRKHSVGNWYKQWEITVWKTTRKLCT